MSEEEDFYLFKNTSSVGPWDGPQYHIAPVWAFHLQAAFMGFVFFAGTLLMPQFWWLHYSTKS
jgi:short wavelength-sensitive opsin